MKQPKKAIVLDALGNAIRRDMLTRLANAPCSVGELSDCYPISRPAVSKHLRILNEANLVEVRSEGTRNQYSLKQQGFDEAREWLDEFWDVALARFTIVAENSEI